MGEALHGPPGIGRGHKPLIVVDGVIQKGEDQADPMGTKISSIAKISVLKNPTDLAVYGAKGAHGAILITTKNATRN